VAAGLLCVCQLAGAAESVIVAADAPLLEAPNSSAKVVTQLKQGMTGEVLARKGAWVNLRTAGGTGWTNSFNVRDAAAAPAPAAKAGPGGLFGAPRAKTTATIGIRGLEAEDLRKASVDPQQMNLLDTYAVSKQDAESAARASGLEPARVEYLAK
jgi:hypothetical protein